MTRKPAHAPQLTEKALWKLISATVLKPRKPSRYGASISISDGATTSMERAAAMDAADDKKDPRWSWDRFWGFVDGLWRGPQIMAGLLGIKRQPGATERIAKVLAGKPEMMEWPLKDLDAHLREHHQIKVGVRTISRAKRMRRMDS